MAAWAVTGLRNHLPKAEITWATESTCAPVVATPELVNHLVEIPRSRWKKNRWSPQTWIEQIQIYTSLRGKLDYGFDLQGHSKTGLMLALSRPKVRWSLTGTDALVRRLNPVVPNRPEAHKVDQLFDVLRAEFPVESPELPILYGGDPTDPIPPGAISLGVGASIPEKKIPTEWWNDLARALQKHGIPVVTLGGPADEELQIGGIDSRVGKTSLAQTLTILHQSRAHVSGDTGTGHLADGYGVPTVTLFTSLRNHPSIYRPYSFRNQVIEGLPDPAVVAQRAIEASQ